MSDLAKDIIMYTIAEVIALAMALALTAVIFFAFWGAADWWDKIGSNCL